MPALNDKEDLEIRKSLKISISHPPTLYIDTNSPTITV